MTTTQAAKTAAKTTAKTERIDVRAPASAKKLLQDAAIASHKSVSEFILDASLAAASQTLADQTRFFLNEEQWLRFQEILDRPVPADLAEQKPRLARLLTEPYRTFKG